MMMIQTVTMMLKRQLLQPAKLVLKQARKKILKWYLKIQVYLFVYFFTNLLIVILDCITNKLVLFLKKCIVHSLFVDKVQHVHEKLNFRKACGHGAFLSVLSRCFENYLCRFIHIHILALAQLYLNFKPNIHIFNRIFSQAREKVACWVFSDSS